MTPLLIAGALLGYALLLGANPIRTSLLDGLRAVQRYPRFWVILGVFGSGYALFQLALRIYFSLALPPAQAPMFMWFRGTFRPSTDWWYGTSTSLWHIPARGTREAAQEALLPALDNLGGLFNCVLSTYPVAALAALLLLFNWRDHRRVLRKALTKRFRAAGWFIHGAILLAAIAALAKPFLYLVPRYFDPTLWFQWGPLFAWLAFLFEYLFGVGTQVYLLLLAYCWLRGLSFRHQQLFDVAIRRFSYVVRWAGVVLLLSTLVVDLPLILKNFAPFSAWLEADEATLEQRNMLARFFLNGVFILFATVQITLTFHNESLRRSWRDHAKFLRQHPGPLGWFIIIAAVHLFLLHYTNALGQRGFGEGTALWVAWSLFFPWLAAFVTAWLLAAWVSVFRRADSGRLADKEWARF